MIGHVSPEACVGGPIALVRNGDTITIDIQNETLDLVCDLTTPVSPQGSEYMQCHLSYRKSLQRSCHGDKLSGAARNST